MNRLTKQEQADFLLSIQHLLKKCENMIYDPELYFYGFECFKKAQHKMKWLYNLARVQKHWNYDEMSREFEYLKILYNWYINKLK